MGEGVTWDSLSSTLLETLILAENKALGSTLEFIGSRVTSNYQLLDNLIFHLPSTLTSLDLSRSGLLSKQYLSAFTVAAPHLHLKSLNLSNNESKVKVGSILKELTTLTQYGEKFFNCFW